MCVHTFACINKEKTLPQNIYYGEHMYVHGACIISLMSSATVQNVGKWHILLVGCIDNVIIRLNVHCTALSQDSTCKISRPDLTLLRVFSITQPPPHTQISGRPPSEK